MQEVASVTQVGGSMAAVGFAEAARQSEGSRVFDAMLSAMMVSDPASRIDSMFSRDGTNPFSRAGDAGDSTPRRNVAGIADDSQTAAGAEGARSARSGEAAAQDDSEQSSRSVSDPNSAQATDETEDDGKHVKHRKGAATVSTPSAPDAASGVAGAVMQAGGVNLDDASGEAVNAANAVAASAGDPASKDAAGPAQGGVNAQLLAAQQTAADKPTVAQLAAQDVQVAQQAAAAKTAEAQQNASQEPTGQAKPDAPNLASGNAGDVPKLWDVQPQTAGLKSGFNSVQGSQPAAFAQAVSAPVPQFQPAQTGTDARGDASNGTPFDGKGLESADNVRAASASSDATGQNGDTQRSEFAQKLSGAGGTARADQAETIDKIVQSMTMALKRGAGEVRMMLQPPRLGSVRIELSVKDGVLNAFFETQTQAARHAISGNLPQLKAALENQGIEVGGFNVTVEQESGQSRFTGDGGSLPTFTAGGELSAVNEEDDSYDIFDEKRRMSAGTSLVDYYV